MTVPITSNTLGVNVFAAPGKDYGRRVRRGAAGRNGDSG